MPDTFIQPPKLEPSRLSGFPARARPMDYWNSFRRLWRPVSREQIISSLKSMAWVVPLTLLIWIYAEREQKTDELGVPFRIVLKSSDPDRILRLDRPREGVITADLAGPRSRLDRVLQKLREEGAPVVIDVDPSLSSGLHERNTASQIANNPLFTANGITVNNAQPHILNFFIDNMVEREIPVQAPPGVNNLQGPATFYPETVKVRAPQALLDSQEKLVVYADLKDRPELNQPGPQVIADVPVIAPFQSEHITFQPASVRANLVVRQSDEEYEIPSMPVRVKASLDFLENYRVESDDKFLFGITVIGPPKQIELLRTLDPGPTAVLEITREDETQMGKTQSRRVQFDIPEGLKVKDEESKIVTFTVSRREPAQ